MNIFIAAPCYSFPGHAGLHLIPGGSASVETPHWFGGSSSSSDAVPMALPDVNIHSSPCYLK